MIRRVRYFFNVEKFIGPYRKIVFGSKLERYILVHPVSCLLLVCVIEHLLVSVCLWVCKDFVVTRICPCEVQVQITFDTNERDKVLGVDSEPKFVNVYSTALSLEIGSPIC